MMENSNLHPAGLPPGTLVHVGQRKVEFLKTTVIRYKADEFHEHEVESLDELFGQDFSGYNVWVNIDGVHDAEVIARLGEHFQLDALSLEDVMNTGSRSKYEEFEGYIFMIVKDLYYDSNRTINEEQISFILKENVLVTFQEVEGDVFDNVRQRLRKASTPIRTRGTDYLAYALIDSIVDNYFITLEHFEKELELLEDRLLVRNHKSQLQDIQQARKRYNLVKRAMLPSREVVFAMHKTENPIFRKKTHSFIRDLYDHAVQITEQLEQIRESVSGLKDIYNSGMNAVLNNIMKILTVVSTVFMALSLIAGIYGMNFENMPETKWEYGYPFSLLMMAIVAVCLIMYFRRKRWL